MGYLQSPRVLPGLELGPQFSYAPNHVFRNVKQVVKTIDTLSGIGSPRYDTLQDTMCGSEGDLPLSGVWTKYPRIGIIDRVRVSGSYVYIPLFWSSQYACEVAVNVFDIGSPLLFHNTALAVIASIGGMSEDNLNGPPDDWRKTQVGILCGTHQELGYGGELELVAGIGTTNVSMDLRLGNDVLTTTDDFTQTYTAQLLDLASSLHFRMNKNNRTMISVGVTYSYPLKELETVTWSPVAIHTKLYGKETQPIPVTVQVTLAFRIGGKKGGLWIADHPRKYQCR